MARRSALPVHLSRSNSEDSAAIAKKSVPCIHICSAVCTFALRQYSSVYICSVSGYSCTCVHYLLNTVKMCVHLLSTAVCTFAQLSIATVNTAVHSTVALYW